MPKFKFMNPLMILVLVAVGLFAVTQLQASPTQFAPAFTPDRSVFSIEDYVLEGGITELRATYGAYGTETEQDRRDFYVQMKGFSANEDQAYQVGIAFSKGLNLAPNDYAIRTDLRSAFADFLQAYPNVTQAQIRLGSLAPVEERANDTSRPAKANGSSARNTSPGSYTYTGTSTAADSLFSTGYSPNAEYDV